MANNKLKVGDLVKFEGGDYLLGVVTEVYYRNENSKAFDVEVFGIDGKFLLCDAELLKRYTVDRSLNKVILSIIKTLEDVDEWVDNDRAINVFIENMNKLKKNKKEDD